MTSRPTGPTTIAYGHNIGWHIEHRPERRDQRYGLRWTGPGLPPATGPALDDEYQVWGKQPDAARWVIELGLTVSQAATGHFSKAVETAREAWESNGNRWPAEPLAAAEEEDSEPVNGPVNPDADSDEAAA